jgi:exosortase A-associated hydrolase 2
MFHRPGPGARRRDAVLFIPPFAEEMNKSRPMLAAMARRLSARGYGALLLDLFGTGDSQGDFGEARWETWRDDVRCAARWLGGTGIERLHVIASRAGALLAADVLATLGCVIGRVVLWQPATSGEAFLTQFLRLRVAASMMDDRRERESTQQLRRALAAGEVIEVAGYALAPPLAQALSTQNLATAKLPSGAAIDWYELVAAADRAPPPASEAVARQWRTAAVPVTVHAVVGDSFWATTEISMAPSLLELTEQLFAREPAPGR